MKTMLALSPHKRLWACGWLAVCTLAAGALGAQSAAPRITAEVSNSEVSTLKGSLHPLAQAQFDAGRASADTRLEGMTIAFNRSAAQQAELDALVAAQQNPASGLFHQWLTPEEFGARFGMAQADLDKVQSWLEQQGFAVDSVARSRTFIRFSGTARQVERAFQTEMHYYNIQGERHLAPSTELSMPAAMLPIVEGVRNLAGFKPHSMLIPGSSMRARPDFTSYLSHAVHFAPGDIRVAYDMNPLSAFDGTGQSITVVGQSAVVVSDVEHFQSAAGLTVKDPTIVQVPGSGNSTIYSGDETESDLDLEWSGAMAPGAAINFVYTGDAASSQGVWDSIIYAVDNKLGQIISISYGACEPVLNGFNLETTFQQAQTQGQTVLAASGDSGNTACFQGTNVTAIPLATQELVAVSYPASSPLVTGVGGTETTAANSAVGTYWNDTTTTSDIVTTAKAWIPEVVWNDDQANCGAADCLSATGGGASTVFAKPSWQSGVPGIPADGQRDIPDISLYSSPALPGYLYCTSDTSAWATTQVASCDSGFRDQTSNDLTYAGGTSFATPVLAGMLALINQKAGYTTGQGLINGTLYSLASNPTSYASAFHDVTTGNNNCLGGAANCTSATNGYTAATGYDQATGLGSIDLNNLAAAWPVSSAPLLGSTTSISPSSSAPLTNANVTFTITVSSNTVATTPTGSVTITVDSGTPVTGNTLNSSGVVTYTTSFSTAGNHTVVAQYLGDATFAASTRTTAIKVVSSTPPSFTLAAAALTVTQGGMGSSALTITPAGGYSGTIKFTVSSPVSLCYSAPNFTVTSANPASATVTIDTNLVDCGAAAATKGAVRMSYLQGTGPAPRPGRSRLPVKHAAFGFAGLLMAGLLGWRRRQLRGLSCLLALGVLGLTLSACGGGGGGTTKPSYTPKGTNTITVTGTDSATSTLTATATFSLTVQ